MAKRKQVKNACVNCQKACKKCDDCRPCTRCVKYNIEDSCINSARKERKRGIKRGPYVRNRASDLGETGSVIGGSNSSFSADSYEDARTLMRDSKRRSDEYYHRQYADDGEEGKAYSGRGKEGSRKRRLLVPEVAELANQGVFKLSLPHRSASVSPYKAGVDSDSASADGKFPGNFYSGYGGSMHSPASSILSKSPSTLSLPSSPIFLGKRKSDPLAVRHLHEDMQPEYKHHRFFSLTVLSALEETFGEAKVGPIRHLAKICHDLVMEEVSSSALALSGMTAASSRNVEICISADDGDGDHTSGEYEVAGRHSNNGSSNGNSNNGSSPQKRPHSPIHRDIPSPPDTPVSLLHMPKPAMADTSKILLSPGQPRSPVLLPRTSQSHLLLEEPRPTTMMSIMPNLSLSAALFPLNSSL